MRKFETHVTIDKELKTEYEKELDYSILDNWSQPYYDHAMSKGQFQVFLYWKRQLHEYVFVVTGFYDTLK